MQVEQQSDPDYRVFQFQRGGADGSAEMVDLLGSKGAHLCEMAGLNLPVPPGFILPTTLMLDATASEDRLPSGLSDVLRNSALAIDMGNGRQFGDARNPLLVSVRSGAAQSMPGMLDTILNVGLTNETVEGLAEQMGPAIAFATYRRFIEGFSDIVFDLDRSQIEISETDENHGSDPVALRKHIAVLLARVETLIGMSFPQNPFQQLELAVRAVFRSWHNARAVAYRQLNDLSQDAGTAVTIQAMVFGNAGENSATGVAFSRDPSTGARTLFGEYLRQAQGEDIVGGLVTPLPLGARDGPDSMEQMLPKQYAELGALVSRLERHYADLQDVEFTIEDGVLWLLQTRSGKRSAQAAIQLVVDLASEGLISKADAIMRVDPLSLDQILHPTIEPDADVDIFARGLPASPGAVSGEIVLDPEEAERLAKRGRRVILVRQETNPEDIRGMHAAVGILTTRGGMTSHAAVVARGMGRPCVSGASMIRIDPESGQLRAKGRVLNNHDLITIDGASGRVMVGKVPLVQPALSGSFKSLMDWTDEFKRMNVRVNVETAEDALHARRFGAEGIGLCRTEQFFTGEPRIGYFRKLILAATDQEREQAIAQLLPLQRADYEALFRAMDGKPITLRLLDPPLHSFLPTDAEEIADLAETLDIAADDLADRISALQESNPMLGHRGCRLLITAPHITTLQLRALFEAVISVSSSENRKIVPEILVPFVGYVHEFDHVYQMISAVAKEVAAETGFDLVYLAGPMIELPRAALISDRLAENADFFSYGTNDLTQTVLGIARDDAASYFGDYLRDGVIESDPFVTIDRKGVGEIILSSALSGRTVKPDLMLSICGEHGADPDTVLFCEEIGLDFISCSPFRVPIARLAAAQATLKLQQADPVW